MFFSAIASFLNKRSMLSMIYLVSIAAITLIGTLSADVYMSIETLHPSFAASNLYVLSAVSLLLMFIGVSLFVFFDSINFSTTIKKSMIHSVTYIVAITLVLSLSTYVQYMNYTVLGNAALTSASMLQVMLMRILLFMLGAPIAAYCTCKIFEKRMKRRY